MTESSIIFRSIHPDRADSVSEFLIRNFFPNEPISRALGLPTDQVIRWFPQTICDSLDQNCSVEAVDEKTGRTVGVAVNILTQKDLRNAGGTGEGRGLLEVLDPAQEPVMVEIAKFLGSLNQVPISVYEVEGMNSTVIRTLNCIYLNVLPEYGGRGIAKTLVKMSEKVALQKNAMFMQVDTTSEFSFQIFHKHCGFPVVREISLLGPIPNIEKIDHGVHRCGRILLKRIINN